MIQKTADTAIADSLRQYGQQYKVKQAATVVQSLDGAVRAMVGGSDYGESLFNRAVYALRQPGSSFKPFVYATAFMNGYAPDDMISDAPITIGNWSPRNYGRSYAGRISLRTAIAKSINTVPVRIAESLGRGKIVETAHKLGIRTELKITRALPLGVAEVTALDMVGAYSGFATGGLKSTPYAIEWTKTRAGVITYDRTREPPPEQVLPEQVAYEMNSVLSTAVNAGTGGRALFPGQMQAGKTGTTQAYRDAWFVGYTGWYAASVWFGNDDYTSTANMTGGSLPAITWHSIMAPIHSGLSFKPIPGVPVSADLLASTGKPAEVATATPETIVSPQALTPAAAAVIRDVGASMRARVPAAKAREAALVPAADGESLSLVTPSVAGQSDILLNGFSLLGASDAAAPR